MSNASELRAKARASLGSGIFENGWLYPVLVALIVSAVNSALTFTYIGPVILLGIINLGVAKYHLGISRGRGKAEDISSCFDGFKEDAGGNIILGLLYTVFVALWSLLFVIPGIVKSYSYSMAFYIKADHPEYSANQAITESRRIMDGHKWRLFCLDLSFIGWWIVGSLCLGIGTLWVSAYATRARVEFYRELIGDTAHMGYDPYGDFMDSL